MRVVSGFSPAGYLQYGRNFLDTFNRFWPGDVELDVYTEETVEMPRGECWSLWDCHGVKEFIEKYSKEPKYCGREPTPVWKQREVEVGYSFRTDAVKFCRQMIIPENSAEMMLDGEVLTWLDADVVTFAPVPDGFVEDLLGVHDLVYLGRPGKHSEIGFWAVRLNDRTRYFLYQLAETYRSGTVFHLGQWHSAYVFDMVRATAEKTAGLKAKNLTSTGNGHVWFQSPLCKYTDHLKGDRKDRGRSSERR